jgi:hypothetical protein
MKPTPDFNPAVAGKKLLREGRSGALATLMAGSGDPYCSLVNMATAADGAPLLLISRLAVHTKNILADFADFAFYRVTLKAAHLVAGFGRIVDLKPQDILTETADAAELVAAEPEILAHMNDDHADAIRLYATKLLGAPDGEWRCVGCDPEGLELQLDRAALRLPFPQRVRAPGVLRVVLKQMADAARAA